MTRSTLMKFDLIYRLDIGAYFIDRNFNLYKYCASHFTEGVIERIFKKSLDKSIVNDTCHDLQLLPGVSSSALVLFCRSKVHDEDGHLVKEMYSTVLIENYHDDPKIKYLLYEKDDIIQDH